MEDCGTPTVECRLLGKVTYIINTIIRYPSIEHIGILVFYICILFSYGTDCNHNILVKKFGGSQNLPSQ
jgi:hypothetical protein